MQAGTGALDLVFDSHGARADMFPHRLLDHRLDRLRRSLAVQRQRAGRSRRDSFGIERIVLFMGHRFAPVACCEETPHTRVGPGNEDDLSGLLSRFERSRPTEQTGYAAEAPAWRRRLRRSFGRIDRPVGLLPDDERSRARYFSAKRTLHVKLLMRMIFIITSSTDCKAAISWPVGRAGSCVGGLSRGTAQTLAFRNRAAYSRAKFHLRSNSCASAAGSSAR